MNIYQFLKFAFLQNKEGAEKIKSILKEPKNSILMHAINFGKVYYNALKISKGEANNLFDIIAKHPIKLRWEIDKTLLEKAGKYKTTFRMSYADSYVLAMADINNAQVVSTDHHEFDIVEKNTKLKFYWPR